MRTRNKRLLIDRVYNIDEMIEEQEYVRKGHKVGNVLVKIDNDSNI